MSQRVGPDPDEEDESDDWLTDYMEDPYAQVDPEDAPEEYFEYSDGEISLPEGYDG